MDFCCRKVLVFYEFSFEVANQQHGMFDVGNEPIPVLVIFGTQSRDLMALAVARWPQDG